MRESPQAAAAYRLYMDLGPQRSQEEVSKRLGKSRQLISRWSAAHGWMQRIALYEAELAVAAEAKAKAERLKELDTLRQARLSISKNEQAIVLKWLKGIVNNDDAIGALKAGDIVQLAKSAQDTQRLEYGQATDRRILELENLSDADLLDRARAAGLDREDPPS